MVLKIIVLFLSCGVLVSSDNGYPIMPAQTYPIYQQNGYTNPSNNQPSDFTSYSQSFTTQNQSPPMDVSPFNIRQILLNRILSSHSVQSNFDQNSRSYGSNLAELYNNAIAPNTVNSYFAVPTANNQSTKANKENETAGNKTERKRKKSKKRKSKSNNTHIDTEKNHNQSRKVNKILDNDRESNRKSKKRSRKPKTDISLRDNDTNHSVNENNKKTKKKKSDNNESEAKTPVNEEIKIENVKPQRRHKKKPKSDKGNQEAVVEQTTNKPKQIQEGLNVAHFNEGIVGENRIPRNPTLEANNLFKSIPNLPENIASNFKGLPQGLPQFNNPAINNLFSNFENIYQSLLAKNKWTNEHIEIKKKKPIGNRNNNLRKTEVKNKNATVPTTSKPVVTPKINIVTPQKTIYIKEKSRTNIDSIPKNGTLSTSEKPTEVIEETHEFKNEEIKDTDSNITDPVTYEGYIDDYYPQFTDSAAYTANNREIYIKNLGDTKYYYAVDKEKPTINKMRFESFSLPDHITKDYEINKKYDDAEKEGIDNAKLDSENIIEDEIQFRTPPQLETPDFETRKVEKSEINPKLYYHSDENEDFDPRFLGDKASFYSESKIPYYPGTKESKKKIQKGKPKEVETFFAKSRVVNYGPGYNQEGNSVSEGTSDQDETDYTDYKDEGTTYVLATSLDHPEKYW